MQLGSFKHNLAHYQQIVVRLARRTVPDLTRLIWMLQTKLTLVMCMMPELQANAGKEPVQRQQRA